MPVARLAGRLALLGRLEAVVERVADEVHERVAERVDDGAVELGVLADELELDLLAELGREVADEPREAQEDGLDRDHADLHDHRLQGLRAAREVLHGLREARAPRPGRRATSTCGAVDDELAHEVHQLVEPLGVDAHGRGDATRRRRARRPRRATGTGGGRGSAAPTSPASATLGDLDGGDVGDGGQRRRSSAAASCSVATHASTGGRRRPRRRPPAGAEATTSRRGRRPRRAPCRRAPPASACRRPA